MERLKNVLKYSYLNIIRRNIKLNRFVKKWRKMNSHNNTVPKCVFPIESVSVGKATYGEIYPLISNTGYNLIIGNYCSIAPEVTFIVCSDHYTNHTSTYPFKVMCLGEKYEAISKGDIIVDDDVWIGYRSTIMSGVHIGQGAIVAAGSVVTKDVPPYAIVTGVPAKVLRYRFELAVIDTLLNVNYSKLTSDLIEKHIEELYEENKDSSHLSWMPKG